VDQPCLGRRALVAANALSSLDQYPTLNFSFVTIFTTMSSDSSSSASAPLTPESTGSQWLSSPNLSESQSKRQRRQVAFYPNLNATNKPVKPFSRSAARRESVMTLGSIEHLQHYFTKTGLAADKS
jgi:hypothetical protein